MSKRLNWPLIACARVRCRCATWREFISPFNSTFDPTQGIETLALRAGPHLRKRFQRVAEALRPAAYGEWRAGVNYAGLVPTTPAKPLDLDKYMGAPRLSWHLVVWREDAARERRAHFLECASSW